MRSLLKYLMRQTIYRKLPKLRRTMRLSFDPASLDEETMLVMMMGIARDPVGVSRLLEEYHVSTAAELLKVLPPPPPPDWRGRLRSWWQLVEGSRPTDPHLEEHKKARRLHG